MTISRAIEAIASSDKDIPLPSEYQEAIKERRNDHSWIREIIFRECPEISGAFLMVVLLEAKRLRKENDQR